MRTFDLLVDDGLRPRIRIYLQCWSGGGKNGPILLSGDCFGDAELDWEIDCLIENLEKLRKEGTRKFDQAERKRRKRSSA